MKQFSRNTYITSFAVAAVAIVAVSFIGLRHVHSSHAAAPTIQLETENGSATGSATAVTDPAASSTKAVAFTGNGPGAPPPTPPPAPTPAPPAPSPSPPPSGTSLTVDFRSNGYALDMYSVGATISTFNGGGSGNINRSATWKANLQSLGPLAWRIPLRYNGGNPGSSAGGGQTSGDAQTYIANLKAIGGQPVVVVGGDTSDNNFSNADAAGLVHYFNDNGGQHGGPVHAWVIGNEYTNGGNDPIGYQAHLNGWAAAMKAADPSISLSAPAAPDMKYADGAIGQAVANAGQYIDFLSYHAYQGASAGLGNTKDYETYANSYRDRYATTANFGSRASGVQPALEEFNWAPYYSGNPEFYDWHNTVFIASVIGHSLSGGAHAYQYADSNGPLGLMNDGSGQNGQPGALYTKFPAYWGLAMWTGLNGTFRRFGGHLVPSNSTIANVEVFATDNGKILAINKDTTSHAVTIGLGGRAASGSYDVWQTNQGAPLNPPAKIAMGSAYSNATVSLTLPAGTVSDIEL